MSWLNRRIIAPLFPAWAFSRERYARALEAYYEGGDRERYDKPTRNTSANAAVQKIGPKLRAHARNLEENFDIASGALDVLVNNSVGNGISPEPLVEREDGSPASEVNLAIAQLWDEWIHSPEVTGEHDYYSLQRLVARSMFRDGEAFGQKIVGNAVGMKHATALPYSLQAFECDFVPEDYFDEALGVQQGIKLNAWGRPVEFFVSPTHPGDARGRLSWDVRNYRRVPAERVLHVKMTKRLHQLRGVSVFAPSINRLNDIKDIDDAERIASRIAAAMAAYIKKGLPDQYVGPPTVNGEKPTAREMFFEPSGIIIDDLLPGEDIGTIGSNRPNNALIPFRDSQLRAFASGSMVSYSSVSKNYNGTYSAQRQELVEQFVTYRALSSSFVFRWCQPVYDGFIMAALGARLIDTTGVNMDTIYNASHTAPSMPWIDPESEIQAHILAEEHLYDSKSSIIRKRGGTPQQVYREIQRDREQLKAAGLDETPADDQNPGAQAQRTARAVFRFQQRRA